MKKYKSTISLFLIAIFSIAAFSINISTVDATYGTFNGMPGAPNTTVTGQPLSNTDNPNSGNSTNVNAAPSLEHNTYSGAKKYIPLTNFPGFDKVQEGNFAQFVNTSIQWFMAIAAALAVIMIIRGGLERMTKDSIQSQTDGKKRIEAAIWGLLIALSSYLLLVTINPKLVNLNIEVANVDVKASGTATPAPVVVPPTTPGNNNQEPSEDAVEDSGGTETPAQTPTGSSPSAGDEAAVTAKLAENGITVNDPNRTQVGGMRQSTIDGMIELKELSGSDNLILTGGTESGHSDGTYSHANGYKFDVGLGGGKNSEFDYYTRNVLLKGKEIQEDTNYNATTPSGKKLTVRYEGDHWDILVHP